VAGFGWLFICDHFHLADIKNDSVRICIFKKVTGYPCPACGSTRSMLSLFQGDIRSALMLNPVGLVLFVIIVLAPLLILYDLVFKRELFFALYNKAETLLRKKAIAIPLIALLLINWIWNIYKHL
jgi:hypothetical protein